MMRRILLSLSLSLARLARDFAPHMRDGTGSMVFVSSVTAFAPAPPLGMYAVSKTALLGLVKARMQLPLVPQAGDGSAVRMRDETCRRPFRSSWPAGASE